MTWHHPMPLCDSFLCAQWFSLSQPCCCQSSAVTVCYLAVVSFQPLQWQVELNRTSRDILAQWGGLPGRPVQPGSCCLLKRATWLQSISAKKSTSSFLSGISCPCMQGQTSLPMSVYLAKPFCLRLFMWRKIIAICSHICLIFFNILVFDFPFF